VGAYLAGTDRARLCVRGRRSRVPDQRRLPPCATPSVTRRVARTNGEVHPLPRPRPALLAVQEIGYLSYDAPAADILYQVVSRRYEQKSVVLTENLAFKHWDSVFPNAGCAVALVDRLTHHTEIIAIDWESYRRCNAEAQQTQRRSPK
jgi:hypothetical protein